MNSETRHRRRDRSILQIRLSVSPPLGDLPSNQDQRIFLPWPTPCCTAACLPSRHGSASPRRPDSDCRTFIICGDSQPLPSNLVGAEIGLVTGGLPLGNSNDTTDCRPTTCSLIVVCDQPFLRQCKGTARTERAAPRKGEPVGGIQRLLNHRHLGPCGVSKHLQRPFELGNATSERSSC